MAVISRRAAERLRAGHVWVYQSDIEQIVPSQNGLITVVDGRGVPMGTALFSPASQISLRMVSTDPELSEAGWLQLFEDRLRAAIQLRKPMVDEDTDACRLVFSEADRLPGLVLDRYGDLVLVQVLSKALDRRAEAENADSDAGPDASRNANRSAKRDPLRETIVRVLREEIDPETIVERSDARIRELEQLREPARGPLYRRSGTAAEDASPELATIFHLNGLAFHYDANAGQKTGAFLDQRLNYAAAAQYARGEALDVCCYQGGFALHLAEVCPRVTGIDASRAALEVAEENVAVNRHRLNAEVDWVEANAFDLLRDWSTAANEYDTVVLDPPAFAKSKRAVEGALRGYKELNLRALKMLRPGGTLVTCSCSHHVSIDEFTATVAAAAGDAHRRVRLLERRGAAPDHPVVLNIPETEYLKCLILAVD